MLIQQLAECLLYLYKKKTIYEQLNTHKKASNKPKIN